MASNSKCDFDRPGIRVIRERECGKNRIAPAKDAETNVLSPHCERKLRKRTSPRSSQ